MNRTVNYLSKTYLNNKDINKVIDKIASHLFRYCTKKVSLEYKYSVAIEWINELNSHLLCPLLDTQESIYYNPDFIYYRGFTTTQEKELEAVANEINRRYQNYINNNFRFSKYQEIFETWSNYNHPSEERKGNWTIKQISEAKDIQKQLKETYPELFNRLRKTCPRFNCGLSLIMEVCSKLFVLERISKDQYQLNLKNEEIIQVMREYCDKTNSPYYANEYEKASYIRSILNDLVYFCFSDDFKITEDGYLMMKFHSRLILSLTSNRCKFLFSKSINNHFIIFNDLLNSLHKFNNHSKYNYTKINNNLLIRCKNCMETKRNTS